MFEMVHDAELEAGVIAALDVIRPALQSDGGNIEYVGIDADGVLYVTLVPACGTCAVSTMTLKAGVERIVMDRVPGITSVKSYNDNVIEEPHCSSTI